MTTKAQWFRYYQERTGEKLAPHPRVRRDQPVDTALPGVSATDRRVGALSTADRNRSKRAGAKATTRLEDSASGRPSRKSTRRSANRSKADSMLERRQKRRTRSAKARALKALSKRK